MEIESDSKKSLAEIYDGFAATYDKNRNRFDMVEIVQPFYASLATKKGKLLDLGCGTGEPFAKYFIDQNWTVQGVDFSKQMLLLANKYLPEMETIHADICELSFSANQFDAISAIYSLFHIPRDQHVALFNKLHSWLKPDGRIIFTYASSEYTGCDEFDGYKEFMGEALYYSHGTAESLHSNLTEIGFSVESSYSKEIGGETFLWITLHKKS